MSLIGFRYAPGYLWYCLEEQILNGDQERRRVEEAYAQGLKKLASRRPTNADSLGYDSSLY